MQRIITLTTDFGLADEYAGVMKGVILSFAPQVRIVDLTHGIGRQNIGQAAYVIAAAYKYFPENSIHLVVVDPGVGSKRRLVLLSLAGHYFLAPDNGVLTLLVKAPTARHNLAAYEVSRKELFLPAVSRTFHGRDILAPVAGRLAAGLPPAEVGRRLGREELVVLPLPAAEIGPEPGIIRGAVISVDHFGNLLTNITWDIWVALIGDRPGVAARVTVRARVIKGLAGAYEEAGAGGLLAIFGSRGYLEIAVNRGSAAEVLKAGPGEAVVLACRP